MNINDITAQALLDHLNIAAGDLLEGIDTPGDLINCLNAIAPDVQHSIKNDFYAVEALLANLQHIAAKNE